MHNFSDMETSPPRNDIAFESVLSNRTHEKRTAMLVFPAAVALALIIGFAIVSISRMSGLQQQVALAQKQVDEANKTVEERDRQVREARADQAVLGSAGQGTAVLSATSAESGVSGVAVFHPDQRAMNVYAYNLPPAPEGQAYHLVVKTAEGEQLLGSLAPDDRGAAYLLARNLPEGVTQLEVALLPKRAEAPPAAQGTGSGGNPAPAAEAAAPAAPAERQPLLVGTVPKPGEAGVVMAQAADRPKAQARSAKR
jgi:cell division protein FtsL